MSMATLTSILPEIMLIVAGAAFYLGGVCGGRKIAWRWLAMGVVGLAALVLFKQSESLPAMPGVAFDELGRFGRWLALGAGFLLVLLGWRSPATTSPIEHAESRRSNGDEAAEYFGTLLLCVAGLMFVATASELTLLFVALELISIPTYVLLGFSQGATTRREAAAKYFFLSLLASAILLYGFSFLYGASGTTLVAALGEVWHDLRPPAAAMVIFSKLAAALVFAGISFKLAAVPFHFYAPDVYQGTTYPNAALLSVLPKAAGLVVLVRLLSVILSSLEPRDWQLILLISLVTMTLGNLTALWQDNLRRLLAYSAIAHAGYMLMAFAVGLVVNDGGPWDGLTALWYYLTVYALATLGAFAALEHFAAVRPPLENIKDLAGLGRERPFTAAMLAVCLFSLTGIPPLAGFWGKLLVFGGAINVDLSLAAGSASRWFLIAAVIGVLNAAVAATYYLRITAAMYFRPSSQAVQAVEENWGPWWAVAASSVLLIIAGVYPGPLMHQAAHAAQVSLAGRAGPENTIDGLCRDKPQAEGGFSSVSTFPAWRAPAAVCGSGLSVSEVK